jgi:hypothetical protein
MIAESWLYLVRCIITGVGNRSIGQIIDIHLKQSQAANPFGPDSIGTRHHYKALRTGVYLCHQNQNAQNIDTHLKGGDLFE